MADFGWSYPPGCSDNDIDEHFADGENAILETYQEWATEAQQHMTALFSMVTKMAATGKIAKDDAASIFAEVMIAQDWMENITGQGKKSDEHQKE
jgi:hypothetical protein